MKSLICVSHVKEAAEAGQHELYVEPGAIITAAASDYARDKGISFIDKKMAAGDVREAVLRRQQYKLYRNREQPP